jgi:hypothetical protein
MKVLISVTRESERLHAGHANIDAEFFRKLAGETLFGAFARMELPARELPEARERLPFRPAREKDAPVRINERRRDDEKQTRLSGAAKGLPGLVHRAA